MISSTWLRTASSEMPRTLERLGGDAFTLVDEAEEDVLGADVAVVQQPSFLLCQHHDPPSPIGEAFKHDGSVSACRPAVVLLGLVGSPDLTRTSRVLGVGWLALRRGALAVLLPAVTADDVQRIEAALVESVHTADPVPQRDRLAPDRRRWQAAAARAHRGRGAGVRRVGPRAQGAIDAGRDRLRAGADRLAVPRRRDGRGRHPTRCRHGQRQVGQPAGHPRRRLPAVAGIRRSPPRSAPRSPDCWRARSVGCARARSRSCATPTTRRDPRRATSQSISGKTASLYRDGCAHRRPRRRVRSIH